MYLRNIVDEAYLTENPRPDEIVLLPEGYTNAISISMVVPKVVLEETMVRCRASEPTSEPILIAIGNARDPRDRVYSHLYNAQEIKDRYKELTNEFYANRVLQQEVPQTSTEPDVPEEVKEETLQQEMGVPTQDTLDNLPVYEVHTESVESKESVESEPAVESKDSKPDTVIESKESKDADVSVDSKDDDVSVGSPDFGDDEEADDSINPYSMIIPSDNVETSEDESKESEGDVDAEPAPINVSQDAGIFGESLQEADETELPDAIGEHQVETAAELGEEETSTDTCEDSSDRTEDVSEREGHDETAEGESVTLIYAPTGLEDLVNSTEDYGKEDTEEDEESSSDAGLGEGTSDETPIDEGTECGSDSIEGTANDESEEESTDDSESGEEEKPSVDPVTLETFRNNVMSVFAKFNGLCMEYGLRNMCRQLGTTQEEVLETLYELAPEARDLPLGTVLKTAENKAYAAIDDGRFEDAYNIIAPIRKIIYK